MCSYRIRDLLPGDVVQHEALPTAMLLARITPHPLYPSLALVIWWVTDKGGCWSFDALSLDQTVPGSIIASTQDDRLLRIRAILQGGHAGRSNG